MSSREQFVCLNDGECYSSNDGPHCDCQFSDHDGRNCEIGNAFFIHSHKIFFIFARDSDEIEREHKRKQRNQRLWENSFWFQKKTTEN